MLHTASSARGGWEAETSGILGGNAQLARRRLSGVSGPSADKESTRFGRSRAEFNPEIDTATSSSNNDALALDIR
jgi:hypothetical protein